MKELVNAIISISSCCKWKRWYCQFTEVRGRSIREIQRKYTA